MNINTDQPVNKPCFEKPTENKNDIGFALICQL